MTQEELATKLNISSQAVSKWVNNVTMPDIQLLPRLSVLLGVTIDELFALTDDTHLERIGNMLQQAQVISKDDFTYAEQFLREKLHENGKKAQCLTLLAELHLHRSREHRDIAAGYAKDALFIAPHDKRSHNALRDAMNGPLFDWNFSNHHKLIRYYKDFMTIHPDYWQGYVWLMNYLLEDDRYAEAKETLQHLNDVHPNYLYLVYGGLICKEEGNLPQALILWEQLAEQYPLEWGAWISRGDCMAKICRYEEAVESYAKGYELQPHPKYTDSLESIAHIYSIQGLYEKAAEKYDEIITLLAEDWNIVEGKTVNFYKGEIENVRARLRP